MPAQATSGHNGLDFIHRQKIMPHYQNVVLSKKRLRFTLILHLTTSLLMALKLVPAILDILNIFWQPLEELRIPFARPWEWVWMSSILSTTIAFSAIKTNSHLKLRVFYISTILTAIGPLFYALFIYWQDFTLFISTKDLSLVSETWNEYPTAIFWYTFAIVALQIHSFEIYFSWDILNSTKKKKTSNL